MKKLYILFILLAQISYGQISIGQTSTFDIDGDFEGWGNLNSFFTPVSVANGFLTAGGTESILPGTLPPNRLIIDNITNWGGDYTTVGIGGISFKARNLSGVDMELVVLLFDDQLDENITMAESTSISIPASATSFVTYTIPLLASGLNVEGPMSLNDLLSDVFGMSITRVDDNGDGTESLEFDDIEALSVAGLSIEDYSVNASLSLIVNAGFVKVINNNTDIKTISIFDITGKLLTETPGNKVDVATFSSGFYVAHIQDDNGRVTSIKFIL
ncbi:T9SS type A sorting domain-containing protein [Bizionia arctica]|uniref:Secretion system C-terminal sorting domain-containing protein n=1 Tax=Bizionia arctica TaxID=1495645 RepID=A0A917GM77_9FLAO|nr:T9SS type A sorting domain-containing protein [Bizionia arctica]GGG50924.1 hypothetical protein GCM10010976_22620 [Bizionia arctica]